MPLGVSLGIGWQQQRSAVVNAGLTHDWALGEDLLGPIVDRVGGNNLTTERGQALDFASGDYSLETSGDQLFWLHGKNTLTFGFLLWKDTSTGKSGPGGYYGRPLSVLLDATHTLRCYWSDSAEHNWTFTAPSTGAWHSYVFQINVPGGTARCWVDGVEVTLTPATTFPTGLTFKADSAAWYKKWYIGASSSSGTSHVTEGPSDGKFSRMFATSNLLTLTQAETILRGAPADFPTLTDGHIYVLDTEAETVTCKRDGSSTLTHQHASLSTKWTNATRLTVPHPQKALGRGAYAGKQGVGFQTTGANTRLAATIGTLAAPTAGAWLPNSDMTVHVWAKRVAAASSANTTLLWIRDDATSDGLRIYTTDGTGSISVLTEQGATQNIQSIAAAVHGYGWVHFICTVTGGASQWSYFLPGSDTEVNMGAAVAACSPYHASLEFKVGASASGSGYCEEGQVGRILVYSRALTAAEKLANHKAMRGVYA